ncbi:zinc finger protein 845 [Orussus abietinus]|uniref:zinc finger protein 845 n=1 Tax=Orussus abietinus TaxID=222816 RepID=UPI0006251108|nr:zinc finger protein 845 [Orussus abietinus]
MDEVEVLADVDNVCRLCLSTEGPKVSIFSVHDSSVPLASKIKACLSIEVLSNDKLSTLICAQCVKNVNHWHNYKESCLRSQDKLQQWLETQMYRSPSVITIKQEPMDVEFYEDAIEIISESHNGDFEREEVDLEGDVDAIEILRHDDSVEEFIDDDDDEEIEIDIGGNDCTASPPSLPKEPRVEQQISPIVIKDEQVQDYDTDCNIEIESVTGSELLLNPLAMVVNRKELVMEADSTERSSGPKAPAKKKARRGPHTHYRGPPFKRKCYQCQITLRSKGTYMRHMTEFHGTTNPLRLPAMPSPSKASKSKGQKTKLDGLKRPQHTSTPIMDQKRNNRDMVMNGDRSLDDEEEMIEDVEDELVSMEKDSPLTKVQVDIISQLKTFSCYSCQCDFPDRRSTLNHIRQHMPDLRPYTCIACLTEFQDSSMYQFHCGSSFECAMKIALVVPRQGSEKYFVCNMCLRPMLNRKELLSHLSKHSDKQYEQLTTPMKDPPKLTPMVPMPSRNDSNVAGPYKNGNPAFNHMCNLCGMIYRHKPNMLKHRELCKGLPPDARTSYKCSFCGMTFLVFKKFYSHTTSEHNTRDLHCSWCSAKFRSPSDFLMHHEKHRSTVENIDTDDEDSARNESTRNKSSGLQSSSKNWETFHEVQSNKSRSTSQRYNCALCGQEFFTRAELGEHRNLHLKVKIYSCVICRSMFSSAGALEIHMKDHGIEDPNERNANSSCIEYDRTEDAKPRVENMKPVSKTEIQNAECEYCGKVFSNYTNMKRHSKNIHGDRERVYCSECPRSFKRQIMLDKHVKAEHKVLKGSLQCHRCNKKFAFQANLNLHIRNVHENLNEGSFKCDICDRIFVEEQSLKTHRGWHYRANSRISVGPSISFTPLNKSAPATITSLEKVSPSRKTANARPARARKSFPNPPPQKPSTALNLQCQVCDERFGDVLVLRKHLWDVHCARNKQEKEFPTQELQCNLCTNMFPDKESLEQHVQWHNQHPILSSETKAQHKCETCGKNYSTRKTLLRHRKLHKAVFKVPGTTRKFQALAKKPPSPQFPCQDCPRVLATKAALQRHKTIHRSYSPKQPSPSSPSRKRSVSQESTSFNPKNKKIKVDLASILPVPAAQRYSCKICKKNYSSGIILQKHQKDEHRGTRSRSLPSVQVIEECMPVTNLDGSFSCNVCGKTFPGISNVRQHFSIKHKPAAMAANASQSQSKPKSSPAKSNAKTSKSSLPTPDGGVIMYCCAFCDRHFFTRDMVMEHIFKVHHSIYQPDPNSPAPYRCTNITAYVIKDAIDSRSCPVCKVRYPNTKALKIHYFKYHDLSA